MEFRTCPNCGYKYSAYEYFKLRCCRLLKLKWNCKRCNTVLRTNVKARIITTFLYLSLVSGLTYCIAMNYPNNKFIVGLTPIIVILFAYIFYSFDVLDKKEKK